MIYVSLSLIRMGLRPKQPYAARRELARQFGNMDRFLLSAFGADAPPGKWSPEVRRHWPRLSRKRRIA